MDSYIITESDYYVFFVSFLKDNSLIFLTNEISDFTNQWITLKDTPPLKDTPLSFGSKKLGRRPADCACSGPQAQDFLLWAARPVCVTGFVHVLITLLYLYLIAIHLVQKLSGQLVIRKFFNFPRRKNFKPR